MGRRGSDGPLAVILGERGPSRRSSNSGTLVDLPRSGGRRRRRIHGLRSAQLGQSRILLRSFGPAPRGAPRHTRAPLVHPRPRFLGHPLRAVGHQRQEEVSGLRPPHGAPGLPRAFRFGSDLPVRRSRLRPVRALRQRGGPVIQLRKEAPARGRSQGREPGCRERLPAFRADSVPCPALGSGA